MKMKSFLIALALCGLAHAQAWSGILAPTRAIDWSHAGLPATFPDGETTANPWTPPAGRTQCVNTQCAAVTSAAGSSTVTQINAAIANATAQTYVLLPPGTYTIGGTGTVTISGTTVTRTGGTPFQSDWGGQTLVANGGTCTISTVTTTSSITLVSAGTCASGSYSVSTNIVLFGNNNVTLRGSGPMSTIINFGGSNSEFQLGVCCTGVGSGALSLTSYSAGTNSVTITGVASASNLVAGNMAWIQQCDPGWNGTGVNGSTSQPNCSASGAYADTGGIWSCGVDFPGCSNDINPSGAHTYQRQNVLITNVVNNGGGSYTVTFANSLHMPNWSSNNNAQMIWQAPGNMSVGMGVEALSANFTANTNEKFDIGNTYAWWVKGVRATGYPANPNLNIGASMRGLFSNSLIFGNTYNNLIAALSETLLRSADSDNLVINNIILQSICSWADGQTTGDVIAYNFCRDAQTLYYIAVNLDHLPFESFLLSEGNQFPQQHDDSTHGTHDLDTYFRNLMQGWDIPYSTQNPWSFELDNFQRFDNIIANAIGGAKSTAYQGTSSSVGNEYVWPTYDVVAQQSAMRWGNCDVINGNCRFVSGEVPAALHSYTPGPQIALSGSGVGPYTGTIVTGLANLTLGNEIAIASPGAAFDDSQSGALVSQCAGGANNLNHCSNSSACTGGDVCGIAAGSVNPATGAISVTYNSTPAAAPVFNYLYDSGSASGFANAQPANNNLPCSFFISTFATAPCTPLMSGGTGLSWWKVCTSFSSFPNCSGSTTPPFPSSGPELSGGPYVNGHAYDIPAAVAYAALPVDATMQTAFNVTGSSWASGIETVTVSLASITSSLLHIQGGFQLSGLNPACTPAALTGNGVVFMTGSTLTTVSYALSPNPGVACTGTAAFLFPAVPQFDERVFQTDSGGTPATPVAPSRNIFLGGN